jgi:hypothetical protein
MDIIVASTPMMTAEQRDEFARLGIFRMPGAIAPADADAMCNRVWSALQKRHHVRRNAPDTWQAQRITGTHDLPKSETFAQIGSPAVREALDDLLGRGNWQAPERWGSLLVTFPESRERWELPRQSWHLDFPAKHAHRGLFLVRLFTCLAKLAPGASGTLFVEGSHRLMEGLCESEGVETLKSADARSALIRRCSWVRDLCARDGAAGRIERFMERGEVSNDVELRVVEMTGEPGDVLLTHPLLLHAPSKNCSSLPRLVLSSTVYRSGLNWGEAYR